MKVARALDSAVLTLTLNDPDNRNALSAAMLEELLEAIDEAGEADAIRVVIVTNAGPVFSAGADLNESSQGKSSTALMAQLFSRIVHSPKPFVGRINGHAVAGGVGLACAMDISIAVEHAKFGFTEVRVGVAPAIISTVCLPKMRRADAAAAFLRGNRFLAAEAAELGLINESVKAGELDARVSAVVGDLTKGGPNAMRVTKEVLNRVPTMPFDQALEWAGDVSAELFGSQEASEGMAAYLEKRTPSWSPD